MSENFSEVKKWVAISGTWRFTSKKIEKDVRTYVRKIYRSGGGIVTGGALNVDYFATDEAMKLDPSCKRIKIYLPSTLNIYARHYRRRAMEGVITSKQAEDLISQLERVKKANLESIEENKINHTIDKAAYFKRNADIIKASDELVIFHVLQSTGGGTSDAEEKAKKLGIPVARFDYLLRRIK